jgi:hypothetical protein
MLRTAWRVRFSDLADRQRHRDTDDDAPVSDHFLHAQTSLEQMLRLGVIVNVYTDHRNDFYWEGSLSDG